MSEEIINKVASSGIITIDLEEYYPKEEIAVFDIKPYLFRELILKEKDFREALQKTDWIKYENKIVAVICSVDAIIPAWAYMLIATYLQPMAKNIIIGDEKEAIKQNILRRINEIQEEEYNGKRLIIKGCGDVFIDSAAYMEITKKLLPVAKSIMYGEACSNVPVYKKK
jgi:5'(3')-deoxyribonucleotidase